MHDLLSPRQVATALGVSESSLKRWCDRGLIESVRTAGGHRRLSQSAVLKFLREGEHSLQEPEALGLPAAVGTSVATAGSGAEKLAEALRAGDEPGVRGLLFDLYLAGESLATIGDEVIAPALHRIGELWDCGDVKVYEERLSCQICLGILSELQDRLPPAPAGAPRALGATPAGDPYVLSVKLVELVLRERGWNAASLGSGVPLAALAAATRNEQPAMVWLSVSHLEDEDRLVAGVSELYAAANECGAALAVGGRALTEPLRRRLRYSAFCDTLHHLEEFAATLSPRLLRKSRGTR
jgi:excisionase family DNA binding protein